jgi:hypothetical protein
MVGLPPLPGTPNVALAPPSEAAAAEKRAVPTVGVVYETIRREGQNELERSTAALAWSGLAAGFSSGRAVGFSSAFAAGFWSALEAGFSSALVPALVFFSPLGALGAAAGRLPGLD